MKLNGTHDDDAIKRAEQRQRRELEAIYAGRRSRSWGGDELDKRLKDGFKFITASEHYDDEEEENE